MSDIHFYPALGLTVVLSVLIYNAVCFVKADGTIADRLASGWKGSMTYFGLAWSSIVSVATLGGDALARIVGDPQFAALGDALKSVVKPEWVPYITVAFILLPAIAGGLGRNRTL
jgi:hypothetical protein